MSKVVASNKLHDKSVKLSKTFAYTGVSLLTGLSCNLFEAINLRSDMTVYPNMAKQFLLRRYLLIYMSLLSALSCN